MKQKQTTAEKYFHIQEIVNNLAGSLEMPKEWKEKDIDDIIKDAKEEYFKNKKCNYVC